MKEILKRLEIVKSALSIEDDELTKLQLFAKCCLIQYSCLLEIKNVFRQNKGKIWS